MFKKSLSCALGIVMLVSLSACSSTNSTTESASLNQEYVSTVANAAQKLKDTYTDYIVSTTLEAPDGDMEYIEVQHGGENYTEYSVDSDGNIGTISYGSSDSISYQLVDWFTSEGDYYTFDVDTDGNDVVYSYPEEYNSYIEDRCMLYVDNLLDNATSISAYDDMTLDLGDGEETFTCYKIKVPSSTVKDILGARSYGVYASLMTSEGEDSSISTLCSYYLEDLNMNLTFSDANVYVGIDNNNILRYMSLETGGLGTRMYYTKVVVDTSNSNVRETPDFANAVAYTTTLQELADFVASYDSYDSALAALENYTSGVVEESTEEVTETVEETVESVEGTTEESSEVETTEQEEVESSEVTD